MSYEIKIASKCGACWPSNLTHLERHMMPVFCNYMIVNAEKKGKFISKSQYPKYPNNPTI